MHHFPQHLSFMPRYRVSKFIIQYLFFLSRHLLPLLLRRRLCAAEAADGRRQSLPPIFLGRRSGKISRHLSSSLRHLPCVKQQVSRARVLTKFVFLCLKIYRRVWYGNWNWWPKLISRSSGFFGYELDRFLRSCGDASDPFARLVPPSATRPIASHGRGWNRPGRRTASADERCHQIQKIGIRWCVPWEKWKCCPWLLRTFWFDFDFDKVKCLAPGPEISPPGWSVVINVRIQWLASLIANKTPRIGKGRYFLLVPYYPPPFTAMVK